MVTELRIGVPDVSIRIYIERNPEILQSSTPVVEFGKASDTVGNRFCEHE